jgi:hypothetical protein
MITGVQVCAALYPAVAEAAHLLGAAAVGLVDLGEGAALELDRVGITYSNGQRLGDPRAPVQLAASLVGARPVPDLALPRVVTRVALGGGPAGRLLDALTAAVQQVPAGALPVVTSTWALSRLRAHDRGRVLALPVGRPVAVVTVEGVGVATEVPTLGDRPASGHSTIGVAVLDGDDRRVDAVGRCWARGRWVSWLGPP